ncbi:glycosyltransferase family 2 protein [Parvularcula sp. LCG005]|uniref:glycosyltransferase family 2 protein n=1 Tax=Parvularcula sp. LCG005 TaxID=3078805 RepID=UPI002943F4CB|nr:glycosyltransferase family 2 protein [Parvularcula sp. LCG005]WOI52028.1 glycosyltransferase family 2 protein [Parvularcula sp. LCG005]
MIQSPSRDAENENTPRATVIIINFNSGDRLSTIYAALQSQSTQGFDVIVWDNASTDGSASIPVPSSLNVSIYRCPENLGFAGGIMAAVSETKAEWLAILNPDAYPAPDWLATLFRATELYGQETVLGSVQTIADNPAKLDGLGDVYHISGVAWRGGFDQSALTAPTEDVEIFCACFAATMVHRETFLLHGGLDTSFFCYHEDVDFGYRHRLYGGRAVLVHDAIVAHEGSGITGRYSDFTVYHGIRNRQWTVIKNTPLALLPIVVPLNIFFTLGFLVRSYMLGHGNAYLKGMLAGYGGIASVWRQRGEVLSRRSVRIIDIAKAICWSPIAPFRRAAHFRPIGGSRYSLDD